MSFEEEFPNFKPYWAKIGETHDGYRWIQTTDEWMLAHCLDKERVKKALDKITGVVLIDGQEKSGNIMFVLKSDWNKLYERLGL